MEISILIPHYKSGKVTAHAIHKLLELRGKHNQKIIVIDNSPGHESIEYVKPFLDQVELYEYPKGVLQSHGMAFDFAMQFVKTKNFITIESDSFPTENNWLDYYETFEKYNVDLAGSILQLSGGEYIHPCGAWYSKKLWEEARGYCDNTPYHYIPNCAMVENFPNHLMVHNDLWDFFLQKPDAFVMLPENLHDIAKEKWIESESAYRPTRGPFHNGMGRAKETYSTYSRRTINSGTADVLLEGADKIIPRMGLEPGQWLNYFACAIGKDVAQIPTTVKWMPGRENQQQEYTKMENGFTHVWCGSSFLSMENTEYHDVYEFKKNQVEELYNSLPDKYKV